MPRPKGATSVRGAHGVQSAETVLGLLSAFVGAEQSPMLKTLGERTNMHPAKVHRYLVSLCHAGYVEQDALTSRYRLGPAALKLAFAAMTSIDAIRLSQPLMAGFCSRLEQTVVLAVWNMSGPTIAIRESLPGLVTMTALEGAVMPILRSSIGRVFGAWMPSEKTAGLIESELAEYRQRPLQGVPASRQEADALFQDIRRRGVARVTGQLTAHLHALACPVFDASGQIAAALCTLGPAGAFDSSWSGGTAKTLLDCASRLSHQMGYAGRR